MYAMIAAGMHPSVKNSAALIAAYESGEQWEKLERLMAAMVAAGMTPRMDVWARILEAYEKGEQVNAIMRPTHVFLNPCNDPRSSIHSSAGLVPEEFTCLAPSETPG